MLTINTHQIRILQEKITSLAQEKGIDIEFDRGKRKSDIFIMNLNTEKDNALEFYLDVSQEFPQYLIDVFNLKNSDRRGLVAALIESFIFEETCQFKEKRKTYFVNENTVDDWEMFLDEIGSVILHV